MQDDFATPSLNDEQLEQFTRHLSSKGVNLVCSLCGNRYGKPVFVSVPVLLNQQPLTPASWTRPLIQVECENCGHAAHFSTSIVPPMSK